MSRKTRSLKSLFGLSKSTETARQEARKRRGMRKLFVESLEDRRLLATFAQSGSDLALDLNTSGEALASVAGASNYTLTLTGGTWSGTDSGDVTGNGTATLTVNKDVFDSLIVTDSAAGTNVTLNDSGANAYTDSFQITLDNAPAVTALQVYGSSSFGANDFTANVGTSIRVESGANLSTVDGDISLSANAAGTATGDFVGIRVGAGTIQSTGAGTIALDGHGSGTSGLPIGVEVSFGGKILGGSGSVTVDGTGSMGSGSYSHGVYVNNANSQINSAGGNVIVTGQGGGTGGASNGQGVVVTGGGLISAGGAGTVTVTGTGGAGNGNGNRGIRIADANSQITSSGGDVTVTGQGGGSGGSGANFGVEVTAGGLISAGGTGTVSVTGTGGAATGSEQDGVRVTGASSRITSTGGSVVVVGEGGAPDDSTSDHNMGVHVALGGEITAGAMLRR